MIQLTENLTDAPITPQMLDYLIERLGKAPDTTGVGGAFEVHTHDLDMTVSVLEQLAQYMRGGA